tara:strand:- start:5530 stop:5778 length:249 start_codon:yes stop_codon:yes gene_type:complete
MREHKHLRKIRMLLDVMYAWQLAGPTTSSDEIDDFQIDLGQVEKLKELCNNRVDYKLQAHTLRRFNLYYKKYNLKLQWTTAN